MEEERELHRKVVEDLKKKLSIERALVQAQIDAARDALAQLHRSTQLQVSQEAKIRELEAERDETKRTFERISAFFESRARRR